MTAPQPSFLRFLLAFLLAPTLIGGLGLLMSVSHIPGLDGLGMILAVSALGGAPAYLLAGGPIAWRAVQRGETGRREAVILGLLANFASVLLIPPLVWLSGPLEFDPELAKRWLDAEAGTPPSRFWISVLAGGAVFMLGIFFAPLYAVTAQFLGRLLRVRPSASAAPTAGGEAGESA